jgi:hypothetical protein
LQQQQTKKGNKTKISSNKEAPKHVPFMARKCITMKTPKCILAFEKIRTSKIFTILKKGLKHENIVQIGPFFNHWHMF